MSTRSIQPTVTVFVSTACNSACNEGLMRCFDTGPNDCCNFYNNSMCVDECPSPFVPNSESICVCPEGKTGTNCEDGEFILVSNKVYCFYCPQMLTVVV